MLKDLIKNRKIAYAVAIFCTVLWGTAFPFIKLGYSVFEIKENDIGAKLIFAGLRFLIAGLMVYFALWIRDKKHPTLLKSDFKPIFTLACWQTAGQYIFSYIGLGFTTGINTSVITAFGSFITVLAAPIFFKSDKLSVLKIAGCIIGFIGVLAVNGGVGIGIDTLFGDVFILLSTTFAAAGNLAAKKASANRNPFKVTAFQLIMGSLIILVFGIIIGGGLNLTRIIGVLILLWLSLVSAVAFSLWTALLKYHDASRISMFNLLVPIFGTILSGFILGENVFRAEIFAALILISAGIVLVNIKKREKANAD